jgi:hypothetical protein
MLARKIILYPFLLWVSCAFAQEQISLRFPLDNNFTSLNESADYHGIQNELVADTLNLVGIYTPVANPCLTDPCIPGVVCAITCDDTVYIFTSGDSWFWDEFNWGNYTPFPGDSIRVIGTVTHHYDIFGKPYQAIELINVEPLKTTGIPFRKKNVVQSPSLEQNYPNPFNPSTRIRYRVTVPGEVRLMVYDSRGQEVKCLVNTWQETGEYTIDFKQTGLSSSTYFYMLQVGDFTQAKKMILLH